MTTKLVKRVSVLLTALILPLLFSLGQFQIANIYAAAGQEGDKPADPPYKATVTRMHADAVSLATAQHDCNATGNPLVNCGFETGDFSGWVTTDLTAPFFPLTVAAAGINPWFGFFFSQPTEGSWAALHGFDGNGPGVIKVAQDVNLPDSTTNLLFDYRGAWDMVGYGATLDRHFRVSIEPYGGGVPIQTTTILTAVAGTINNDTGPLTGVIDLSAFAGSSVRISFDWAVPESGTGPAFFQLDNVLVEAQPEAGLYGSTVNGEIIYIDVETGAAELVNTLPVQVTEIEYDNFSGRAFVQESDGAYQGYEIDLWNGEISGPIVNFWAYNGIEYVGTTAYGTAITFSLNPSELRTLEPFSGNSAPVGFTGVGPISGLAYDEDNEIMYGTGGGGITTNNFYTLDLATGVASVVGSSGFTAGGLQFGPDGKLYAGASGYSVAGNLYEIDPSSGAATLVGPTGFGKISGLTLVGIDLSLEKSASLEPAYINRDLTYTLVVKNNGPTAANNVIMTDTLPNSVLFVSASSSQGSCGQAGGVVTCNMGLLTNGSEVTIEIVVVPTILGDIDNAAVVTSDQLDFMPDNDLASKISTVELNKIYLPYVTRP